MPIDEALAVAIVQPEATHIDALAFMGAHRAAARQERGVDLGDALDYCSEQSFNNFIAARKAWNPDAPPRFALPHLGILLQPYVMGTGTPDTFMTLLTNAWHSFATWSQSQQSSTARPPVRDGETPEERAKRLARIRQARHRLRMGTGGQTVPSAEAARATALATAYSQLQDAYAARRTAIAAVEAKHADVIAQRVAAWQALRADHDNGPE